MKLLLQGGVIIASFFTMWIGLRQLDWVSIFHVKEISTSTEEKLGELYWNIYKKLEDEETSKSITNPIDSLLNRICDANGIDADIIKLHIIRKDQVNAFALPDHHLVLFTDLILDCENEAELCGVMAHELAHISNKDTTHGAFTNRVIRTWSQIIDTLERDNNRLRFLFTWFGKRYTPFIINQSFPLRRNAEYLADKKAAEATSPNTAAEALTRLRLKAIITGHSKRACTKRR